MLRRNLVYTAVTRGKRLVVVVGQPKALAIAVKGSQTRRQWSKLGEWLSAGGVPAGPARRYRGLSWTRAEPCDSPDDHRRHRAGGTAMGPV